MPVKQENKFVSKIKKFLKNLFFKEDKLKQKIVESEKEVKYEEAKGKFDEKIIVEINDNVLKEYRKREFIEEIEDNLELIDKLSIERLEQLNEYYDKIIGEYKVKISKLKEVMNAE